MSSDSNSSRASVDNSSESERRVRVRYTQALKTFCQRGTGELDQIWWMGKVRDISCTGIGLVIQHRFDPETVLVVELENSNQTQSQSFQVRVIRTTPQPDGRWFLGCVFTKELTDAELKAVL
jgi:hypothetical protein